MNRYDQTTFGDPGGDCFSTCVRCVLEIEDEIPNFCSFDDWWARLQTWLRPRDLVYVDCTIREDGHQWEDLGFHLFSGDGPRGVRHTVVGWSGGTVWDPHPDRSGLLGDRGTWMVGLFARRFEIS